MTFKFYYSTNKKIIFLQNRVINIDLLLLLLLALGNKISVSGKKFHFVKLTF